MFLSFRLIRVFRGQNIVFIFSLSSFQTASKQLLKFSTTDSHFYEVKIN